MGIGGGGGQGGQGKKRKAGGATEAPEEMHPKSRLIHGLALLMKRSMTKSDTIYTMGEHEGGFQATLTIPGRGLTFVGELQPTKKLAEAAAAQQALDALASEIEAAEEAHRAAKRAKSQASSAAWKERE